MTFSQLALTSGGCTTFLVLFVILGILFVAMKGSGGGSHTGPGGQPTPEDDDDHAHGHSHNHG